MTLEKLPLFPSEVTLHAFETIGSTNDEAKTLAEKGATSWTVVWAKEQTAGRGRRGRSWSSPVGNLYCSTILRLREDASTAGQLSFIAALAIADTAREALPVSQMVRLKWPNDVLVNGAKVSGILLEADLKAENPWVVLGIGINIASHPTETPYPATCLAKEGLTNTEPGAVLSKLLHRLKYWHDLWERQGFEPLQQAWLSHAQGLGQSIVVRLPHAEINGTFISLTPEGVLILKETSGTERRISAGDVFFP